ncbi:asparaginase [Couchioplanes caeruleus]|uniref:Asparaginase n=2 Tax=Couchioplanes caeruleus TaxID=56438 RepID=A0A1K0FAV8_9ACTN|nr:asparaginase [Couchioplanes caeruleus]OJF09983.1 asparaginase [Couchioplanes caeruleus subsp. caeruleus]ROP31685.1 asparaginase [Couchioplanes caeruleus]
MILAEVVRSGFVEGIHHGSVVVLDASGAVVSSAGDVTGPMFPRSSNKPMQTVGMLRAGLRTDDPADLALISGSHSGEPFHVDRVRSILRTAGLTEDALLCPEDLPLAESARHAVIVAGGAGKRVYMNCSGKHAGMLATCVVNGWPLDDYRDAKHPLQGVLAEAVTDLAGEPIAATGIDGCGAPVFGFSLTALARGFHRLAAAPDGPERAVADAIRAHPELVAGTGQDDTLLMRGVPGLLAKGGAEGVVAVAVPGAGAVAIKIADGGMRARTPVLVSALRRLGVDAPVLDELATVPLLGGGVRVGEVRAAW